MKKFFALVLAVTMLASSSVAFASVCTGGFDWTEVTLNNCGQGTIEVIPYVKVNDGCGGFNWVANECAGAVTSEPVYFALRLTIEGAPDPEWWDRATVDVEFGDGLELYGAASAEPDDDAGVVDPMIQGGMWDEDEEDATTWWYNFTDDEWVEEGTGNNQVEVDDGNDQVLDNSLGIDNGNGESFSESPYILAAWVADASEAELTATLASTVDFTRGVVGNYYVVYTVAATGTNARLDIYEDEDAALNPANYLVRYEADGNNRVEDISTQRNLMTCAPYTAADIDAFFGITWDTRINQDLIDSNFGWDDEIEDPFKWGTAATAIIDSTCDITIPKTGDVSVIAYAVMALVAAAGAVGLKK